MSESLQQELSRRCRFELARPHKTEPEEGLTFVSKTKNNVKIQNLRIHRLSTTVAVYRDVPPTRGMRFVFEENWDQKSLISVGSSADVFYALDVLRKHQVLDDLSNV